MHHVYPDAHIVSCDNKMAVSSRQLCDIEVMDLATYESEYSSAVLVALAVLHLLAWEVVKCRFASFAFAHHDPLPAQWIAMIFGFSVMMGSFPLVQNWNGLWKLRSAIVSKVTTSTSLHSWEESCSNKRTTNKDDTSILIIIIGNAPLARSWLLVLLEQLNESLYCLIEILM
jgi:hypothetical protein